VEKFWQFTLIGLFLGIGVGSVGLIAGVVLGIIHRNDA
jgi:hypothetical protein